jgi:taurine-pyruvate aminotransferase
MSIKIDKEIAELDKKHVWHHLTPAPLASQGVPMFVRGEGLKVWDSQGNCYLDASAGGVWVTNVGYGRSEIAQAVASQLETLNFFASAMGNLPAAEFAGKLIEKMPGMSRVYYSSSGSEANEKAFKMVRQISHQKYGGKKYKILYRDRDYHGTTLAALSATGQAQRKAQYGPFVPGFVEVPHCYAYRADQGSEKEYGVLAAQAIEKVILEEGADTIGALILEPITAGGGVITPPEGYWPEVQRICRKYSILLIMDEVVCGIGRTGKWFGYQHYDIQPDIVTMAKGVASGYAAISCTVTTEAVYDLLNSNRADPLGYFRDISTYGGCMAGPAAALANMEIIEREELVKNSEKMGWLLLEGLKKLQSKYEIIGDVRGQGLFCGIELVTDRLLKSPVDEQVCIQMVGRCKALGLLIGRTNRSFEGFNNILNLSPALCVSSQEITHILEILDQAFSELSLSA